VRRRSVLSIRAGGSVDSVLPLRGYLLSVGGALLCLLFAADWVLPAPLPSRFSESGTALPPIRIHSDVKRPESVVINTNEPLPAPADKEVIVASAQLQSFDPPAAAEEPASPTPVDHGDTRPATLTAQHLHESLAQSVADQAPGLSHREAASERRHKSSHARSGKLPRSAGHSRPDGKFGWCGAANRGACSDAFMPFRAN
jgi:hypothetical protein